MRAVYCATLVVFTFVLPAPAGDFKPEPGFTLLLNGKNFDGWKTKTGGESLEGKTEAYKGRFKVVDGKLVIDPKVKGDVIIETAKPLKGDMHIKFEFLPGPGCNNDLFLRGLKFDIIPKSLKAVKEGEWNQFEITTQGATVEYKCNGVVQRTSKAKMDSSPFGIRAEIGPIEIRHMRVKETP
jgi:3-keto-disaccharide hydrolase